MRKILICLHWDFSCEFCPSVKATLRCFQKMRAHSRELSTHPGEVTETQNVPQGLSSAHFLMYWSLQLPLHPESCLSCLVVRMRGNWASRKKTVFTGKTAKIPSDPIRLWRIFFFFFFFVNYVLGGQGLLEQAEFEIKLSEFWIKHKNAKTQRAHCDVAEDFF